MKIPTLTPSIDIKGKSRIWFRIFKKTHLVSRYIYFYFFIGNTTYFTYNFKQ